MSQFGGPSTGFEVLLDVVREMEVEVHHWDAAVESFSEAGKKELAAAQALAAAEAQRAAEFEERARRAEERAEGQTKIAQANEERASKAEIHIANHVKLLEEAKARKRPEDSTRFISALGMLLFGTLAGIGVASGLRLFREGGKTSNSTVFSAEGDSLGGVIVTATVPLVVNVPLPSASTMGSIPTVSSTPEPGATASAAATQSLNVAPSTAPSGASAVDSTTAVGGNRPPTVNGWQRKPSNTGIPTAATTVLTKSPPPKPRTGGRSKGGVKGDLD